MAQSKIVIFLGSVRPGRMAERVGKFVQKVVEDNGMIPVLFDPVEMPFELVKVPMHFMRNPEEEAPEWLKEADATIRGADGFIIVSAEYNCGIPPALSNMMDHFSPASFRHRPCGLVTYSMGSFGGVRASLMLRPFTSELGLVSVPAYATIPTVHENFDEEGNSKSERISANITKLVKEVAWYSKAIASYKEIEAPSSYQLP